MADEYSNLPRSPAEARRAGLRRFFNGKPCAKGRPASCQIPVVLNVPAEGRTNTTSALGAGHSGTICLPGCTLSARDGFKSPA